LKTANSKSLGMFSRRMTEPYNVMLRKKQPQFLDDSFDDFQYKREIQYFMRDCNYGLICA